MVGPLIRSRCSCGVTLPSHTLNCYEPGFPGLVQDLKGQLTDFAVNVDLINSLDRRTARELVLPTSHGLLNHGLGILALPAVGHIGHTFT